MGKCICTLLGRTTLVELTLTLTCQSLNQLVRMLPAVQMGRLHGGVEFGFFCGLPLTLITTLPILQSYLNLSQGCPWGVELW